MVNSGATGRYSIFRFTGTKASGADTTSGDVGYMIGGLAGTTPQSSFLAFNNVDSGGAGIEVMRTTGEGRVGIGTTAPTQKLYVNGSVNISRNININ